jgi:TetR/AcrR family transcriptional repressor of nem operon
MAKHKDITKDSVLEAAAQLLRQRGSNGFSTRALADELGISSASVHHHFATKDELLAAVVARCRERINAWTSKIAVEFEDFEGRVRALSKSIGDDALLISMTAADYPTLGPKAQAEARQMFANLRGWLTRFAQEARGNGELPAEQLPESIAASVVSALIGRALLARTEDATHQPVPNSTWAWLH